MILFLFCFFLSCWFVGGAAALVFWLARKAVLAVKRKPPEDLAPDGSYYQ